MRGRRGSDDGAGRRTADGAAGSTVGGRRTRVPTAAVLLAAAGLFAPSIVATRDAMAVWKPLMVDSCRKVMFWKSDMHARSSSFAASSLRSARRPDMSTTASAAQISDDITTLGSASDTSGRKWRIALRTSNRAALLVGMKRAM